MAVYDSEGDLTTTLVNNKECSFVTLENGIAKCSIEKAHNEGVINFRKPISCHLFPIRIKEYPDFEAPVIDNGQYQGVIGQGGLMLCRIPEETAQERNEYYGGRTREQMTAVDQDLMKEQHPSMPIEKSRRRQVTFGKE